LICACRDLTGLERKKIEDEYKEVIKLLKNLKAILGSEEKRYL
jgi:DNA gyrase subunit A